jgi:hypothetical protein
MEGGLGLFGFGNGGKASATEGGLGLFGFGNGGKASATEGGLGLFGFGNGGNCAKFVELERIPEAGIGVPCGPAPTLAAKASVKTNTYPSLIFYPSD